MGRRFSEFRTLDRFQTPRTFSPVYTFPEACVAVSGALARIFLGSLLFGVCGALAWHSWATLEELWLRALVVAVLGVVFVASFAALMIAIQAGVDGMLARVRAEKT